MSEPCSPCQKIACPTESYLDEYALTGLPQIPVPVPPPIPPEPPTTFTNDEVTFCCTCP